MDRYCERTLSRIAFNVFLVLLLVGRVFAQKGEMPPPEQGAFHLRFVQMGCLGDCPRYDIEVNEDGSGKFVGRAFVASLGVKNFVLSAEKFEKLKKATRELRLGKPQYQINADSDLPRTMVTVHLDDVDYSSTYLSGSGPLSRFQATVEDLIGVHEWISGGKGSAQSESKK